MKKLLSVLMVGMMFTMVGCGVPTGEEKEGFTPTITEEKKEEEKKEEVQEFVVYDKHDIKVTYKSALKQGTLNSTIEFLVENNSDKDFNIATSGLSVNGFMSDGLSGMYCDVLAGKKSLTTLRLYNRELKEMGIEFEDIKDIEFKFWVYQLNAPIGAGIDEYSPIIKLNK